MSECKCKTFNFEKMRSECFKDIHICAIIVIYPNVLIQEVHDMYEEVIIKYIGFYLIIQNPNSVLCIVKYRISLMDDVKHDRATHGTSVLFPLIYTIPAKRMTTC